MRQGYLLPLALAGLVSFAGCRDNQFDYKTWTKKLDDSKEAERAVDNLEHIGNPAAIPALGKAWDAAGRPVRMLNAIISIARPLTPKEAEDAFATDYVKTGRKASWDAALPFLTKALNEVDDANSKSVESAVKAADAIGEGRIVGGLDACVDLASKPLNKKLIDAQVAAARALGKLDGDKERATAALIKIIEKDPPPHPSTGKTKDAQRSLGETYELYQRLTTAAVNSLGDLHASSSAKALVKGMYRAPSLFAYYRRALVAVGPTAKDQLQHVVRGDNTEVDQFLKDKKLDQYCGDQAQGPCVPVSARDYYASVVLGDFYDPAVVPDLLLVLKREALPVYYDNGQPSPNTQWNAVFDAARKIGATEAAAPIKAIWDITPPKDPNLDNYMLRAQAIDAYPFLVRDSSDAKKLAAIADDNGAKDELRQSAATSFARISRSPDDIKVLKNLAKKYFDAAKAKAAEGLKLKPAADVADKSLADSKKKMDDAKIALVKMTKDTSKTTKEIQDATKAAKELGLEYKDEKEEHSTTVAPYKETQQWVKLYTNFARQFLTHIARVEVGIRCGDDLKCLVATLDETPDSAKKHLAPYLTDVDDKLDTWDKDQLSALVAANVERGMLDLGKKGQAASQYTDALLDHANTTDRIIRQSILLALPKIAKVPCATCETKLDAVIKSGNGQLALKDLNTETLMMRNYFGWAGGKTPAPPSAEAAAPAEAPADK